MPADRAAVPGLEMSYEVKTRVFEGPLDLLLGLITSHQLEITELRLADIVSEYLAHLEMMRELDMEITSEFVLIAATLVQLKARYLLPGDSGVDLDEELALAEERDRLLARLLSCLTFKDVAAVLAHRIEAGERYVPRLAGLDPDITPVQPEVRLDLTLDEFASIAGRALRAPIEPDLDHLELDLPSVDEAIADLRSRVHEGVATEFEHLVDHLEGRLGVIAYFLALLELVRWGAVRVSQDDQLSPIRVAHNPDGHPEGLDFERRVSEWTA
jgi:segregation and condensation protein A